MSGILKIKTSVPPLGAHMLSRSAVTERLRRGLRVAGGFTRRLSLVSAPAGFGKTTLVRSWLAEDLIRTAWYSLDGYDNDPGVFWSYVIAALQAVEQGVGKASLEIIRSSTFAAEDSADSRSFLAPLLNDLFSLKEPMFLVLDDLHLISSKQIHQDMIFFLENIPTTLHLVVTTRSDPPWPLFRWRARGEMAETRLNELKLTEQEAGHLFSSIKGVEISDAQLAALYDKTEGWVTALHLAAVSLGRGANPDEYIRNFTGSHRDVFHFLGEEVFVHQPKDVRQFLLQTSILSRFSAPLCDAVTGRKDSGKLLADLERDNVFVIPLDEQGYWFRYHQLFRDLLLFHLKRDEAGTVIELYARACQWFLAQESPGEALRYAMEAEDLEKTAEILHNHYVTIMNNDGFLELLRWPEAMPLNLLRRYPRLVVQKAFFLLILRGKEDVAECIQLAEQLGYDDPEQQREYLGMLWAIKAYYNIYDHNLSEALTNAELALKYLPPRSYFWRMAVANFCGDTKFFADNPKDSYNYYRDAHQGNLLQGQQFFAMSTGFKVAVTLATLGRIHEAKDLVEQMLKLAREEGLAKTSKAGSLWALLGDLLREKGELAEAERCVERGLFLIGESDQPILSWNLLYKVALAYSQDNLDVALQCLLRIEDINGQRALPFYTVNAASAWKARILLRQGVVQPAREFLASMGVSEHIAVQTGLGQCYVTLARVLLATGETPLPVIKGMLQDVQKYAEPGGNVPLKLNILLTLSLLEEQKGSLEAAEENLLSALQLGMSAGYLQVFVDELPEVGPILMRLVERLRGNPQDHTLLSYCQHICQRGSLKVELDVPIETRQVPTSLHGQLVEELSPRELEVLGLIGKGMSNQEICDTLYLSMGTVKWHTGNIYAKLGVRGRTQALARARELKLLV